MQKRSHPEIREAISKLCAEFGGSYWRALDEKRQYPTEFISALSAAGYLSILIPEEYGGSGANCKSKGSDGRSIFSEQWGCYTRWNRPVAPPEPASSEPLPEFDSAMFFSNGVEAI